MTDAAQKPLVLQDGSEFPRTLAIEKLRRTSAARDTLIEEHSAAFRWLMASFLALNGGGLVAVSSLEIDLGYFVGSGLSFWVGVICALGLAWRTQVINRVAIDRLSEIERVWTSALGSDSLHSLEAQKADEGFASVSSFSAKAFSWASVAAFSFGDWIAGVGLL